MFKSLRLLAQVICLAVAACGAGAACAALMARAAPALKVETYRGRVVSLTERLKKRGIEVDLEVGLQLGLETDEGKVYPLVRDGGSRLFFRDPRLLDRPMQAQGRLIPETGLLQLTQVFSLKNGKPHEVYYWCEVCAIKRLSLEKTGLCECCGGVMELREVPK